MSHVRHPSKVKLKRSKHPIDRQAVDASSSPAHTNFVNLGNASTTSYRGQVYQEQTVQKDVRNELGQFLLLDKEQNTH